MSNEETLKSILIEAMKAYGLSLTPSDVVLERSKDPAHGDYATNLALRYGKSLGFIPRNFALELAGRISDPTIDKIEVAGPGFINFFLHADAMTGVLSEVFRLGDDYGRQVKKGVKVNLEFFSANPTGDIHLGHTRIGAFGDSLAEILIWDGYDVTREYYVNDCGNQVEHLGNSLRARYHELYGEPLVLGDDDYHGVDLIDIAKQVREEFGDKYLVDNQESHDFFIRYGIDAELKKIKNELDNFRIHFDRFSYESEIRKKYDLGKVIEGLKKYTYQKDGATYLRTSAFLDDKDRPIVKSNGQYTYFMPDIAYHYDKMARGYDLLIDVLGADHHGYINRMKSALAMKGYDPSRLEVDLIQMVKTYRDGVEVKMSKRTGKAISHHELVEEVGVDAVRYLFVERSPSTHLDFDYNLALEQSSSNPVYYAQYAHARCCSLLTLGQDIGIDGDGALLSNDYETAILKHIADFGNAIEGAARERAPYRLCAYIHKLAELVHEFYAHNRVIDRDNLPLTRSRLSLVKAAKITLHNALGILGVSSPEKM
ncbi:MAG: arginine--tRNA ligase [Erysipelotrichaceae bacterium]|nr:arginine--tRNA ligase [Erysipelotrichaceae bacterium]